MTNILRKSIEIGGRTLTLETGRMAKQAHGAIFASYGDTQVLSCVTVSDEPREGIDFFPLQVEFEEKMYAVGKIPGGFIKREGRPAEKAILSSRLIDRPLRPLFPKGFRNDVQVVNTVPVSYTHLPYHGKLLRPQKGEKIKHEIQSVTKM